MIFHHNTGATGSALNIHVPKVYIQITLFPELTCFRATMKSQQVASHFGLTKHVSCTAQPSCAALSEEAEGNLFQNIRRHFKNGRRNALCGEEIDVRVKTEPMRRETGVNFMEISDQMELLVVCRKRNR